MDTATGSKGNMLNPSLSRGELLAGTRGARPCAASALRIWESLSCAALFLSFALTATGCTYLIEWGWDEPDQTFLKAHIAAMERKPFDGVVFHLTVPSVPPGLENFSWHLHDHRYQWDEVRPAVEELKAVPFRRFRHNFLRINLNPGNRQLDFLDNRAWETVFSNLRLAAMITREVGLKGLMVDPEAYIPRFNIFNYGLRISREVSFESYRSAAFQKGRQAAVALGETAPDLILLFAFAYSLPCGSPTRKADESYGLLPAFIDGILSAKPKEMVVIEGHESSYPFRYCPQFQEAYSRLRGECQRLSLVPDRYDRDLQLGFGIWIDNESTRPCAPYREEGKPCPWADPDLYPEEARHQVDVQIFQEAVTSALDLTDGYVWIYSEEPKWWTAAQPDGANLPAEFVEAIKRAKEAAITRKGSLCQKPPLTE